MAGETRTGRGERRKGAAPRAKGGATLLEHMTVPDVGGAFDRLARQRALPTLVRGALPVKVLRRLLRDAVAPRDAGELPDEVWSSLAAGIALEAPEFGLELAEELHDRLGWDREPATLDDWWPRVVERPLEALWNAALSADKTVRREFAHIAEHCVENYRDSPECLPPSWEFLDAVLDVHARQQRGLRDAERRRDEAERRLESERERLEELRDELKKLRRENSELRGKHAHAERRAEALSRDAASEAGADARRLEELERRARKAEKERDHLWAELERARRAAARAETPANGDGGGDGDEPGGPADAGAQAVAAAEPEVTPPTALSHDTNPRQRMIRRMLRKLVQKGKIGAAHTHEDNVYRGVADHEKGLAKEAMDLLYLEGFFVPKPTAADPHVSIDPERLPEVQAMIAGRFDNPRLQRFCAEE